MLCRCPHHDFLEGQIDAACGGTIRKKPPIEAYTTIEDMASNSNNCFPGDRHVIQRLVGMYQVHIGGAMERKLDALTRQIESLI
ncbi:hypothetical protein CR513_00824, partial [Mucuna pruriens]